MMALGSVHTFEVIMPDTYTTLILSKLVLGNEIVLTSVLVATRRDGQCVCAFLQPILNILGLKSKTVELIFGQLHIIMEPEQNVNMQVTRNDLYIGLSQQN
jgi:hypothetical protein